MTFGSPHGGTVAILAQGTDWAVVVTQAFFVRGSIPAARRTCLASLVDQHLSFDVLCHAMLICFAICYTNLRELVQLPHNRSCVSVGAVVNCGERRGGCRLRKRSNATNKGI